MLRTFLLMLTLTGPALAQFTPGNLLVVRVGDGTTALSTAAAPVSLREFTPLGTPSFNFDFDTTGGNAFTLRGNGTTNGSASVSSDGLYVYLGGNNAASGTAAVETTAPATVNRIIARISTGGADVSTRLNDAPGALRGAAGIGDGTTGMYAMTENGVRYTTFGTSGTSTNIFTGNMRAGAVLNNNLYISTGSAAAAVAPFALGVGVFNPAPIATAAPTGVVTQAAGTSQQFIFLDRDLTVTGFDTLYVADNGSGQIDKYSFDGTAWTARGSAAQAGVRGVTGSDAGELYFNSASTLFSATDTAAFDATIALTAPVTLSTAGTNFAYLGVTFSPVPEPMLFGAGLIGVALLRRRR